MLSIAIKDKGDIYFATDSARLSNQTFDKSISTIVLDQLLVQDIKAKRGKSRVVIYADLYSFKVSVLRYVMQDVLSSGEELTCEYITNEVVPHVFKSLKKYKMLGESKSGFKSIDGDIIVIGDDKIFNIDSLGYVIERDISLEQTDPYVKYIALANKNLDAEEAIEKTIEVSGDSMYPDPIYPIVTGSLKSKKWKVITGKGKEARVWRSKFRCQ